MSILPIVSHYRLRMRSFWRSIKGKIFLVFIVIFCSGCILTLVNFWSMNTVKTRLNLLERYEELLSNVLEVRRFEKNYLFYNDAGSLQESLDYLKKIDALFQELGEDVRRALGNTKFSELSQSLLQYRQIIEAAQQGKTLDESLIRGVGKTLVNSADALLKRKRAHIHKAVERTAFIPFGSLLLFCLLIVLVIIIIQFGLLRPLRMVKIRTQRVARGDFRPLALQTRQLEEVSALIEAFNHMAQELETNQEDLLQARKIAALGTFTAGIAHELNNPVNNISLTAETLEDLYAPKLDEDGREMIHDILIQADRAGEIVKNLLDFSRTERPIFTRLKVEDIVDSTVNLLKNQLMLTHATLETDIPSSLPPVHGNLNNLQQVFMNLLLNATQAMPDGGDIKIVARPAPKNLVRIDVCDTGTGIEPEIVQHIFEPFFTTKEVGNGTGLGLALMYSIVRRHGGRVEIKSEPDKGSVFSVFLPAAEQLK